MISLFANFAFHPQARATAYRSVVNTLDPPFFSHTAFCSDVMESDRD